MKIKAFLISFMHTFLPHKYKRNVEKKLSSALDLYFKVLFLGMFISFLIFIPVLKTQSGSVIGVIDRFDVLNISIDYQTNAPVTLLNHPEIVVDTNATQLSGQKYLFSNDTLFYKKNIFKNSEKDLTKNIDLTSKKGDLVNWLFYAELVLLPAYLLAMGITILVLTILMSLLLAFIVKIAFKKQDYSYRDCFMGSLHASMPSVFIFLVFLPFYNLVWLSLLLMVLIYTLGLLLMKGHKFESVDLS